MSVAGKYSVGVDTGGTFTDITLVDRSDGRLWKAKTPSTPQDPSRGFLDGIRKVMAAAGIGTESMSHVFHGTTVATNAILENKGANAVLLTTAGFRHVVEIGRHDIPRRANMYGWVKPRRPVPPERIFEIPERVNADGSVATPLDEEAVRAAVHECRVRGIDAISVCYLHSFAHPEHEVRTREIIAEDYPEAHVSLSVDVLPVFREFERSMATILNVYVMPLVSSYVGRLQARLEEDGVPGRLLLMKSSGGVTGASTVRRVPVHTALSGPAAGVVGALREGHLADTQRLITLDIGGTSADICLIDGEPKQTSEGTIGDWPLRLPMIDIHTIGAGGGSIARVTETGGLVVGPESAGAEPGPVCYGRGGEQPTVTDAHVALGHLPDSLVTGAVPLDREAAVEAIRARIAEPLGMSVEQAAAGILSVANNNMIGAIRVVSVERGHDPRGFALLAFGGAGPLHGGDLMDLMGLPSVIVPRSPGVLSAYGLLVSDVRNEFVRTCLQRANHYDIDAIASVFRDLTRQARQWLDEEGVPDEAREIRWSAGLRYVHQGFELSVPWPLDTVDDASVAEVIAAFHAQHEQLYTFAQHDTSVELVNLRVDAIGALPSPEESRLSDGSGAEEAKIGDQPLWMKEEGWRDCPIYDRDRLGAGDTVSGPAIIQQMDTTTLILNGQTGRVHTYGSLVITKD
jgi:N-methylhydantoinase A